MIEAEKGGKLQMFEGCVSGEYTELVQSSYSTFKGGGAGSSFELKSSINL